MTRIWAQRAWIFTLGVLLAASTVAWGDSLQLHDGRHFEGHYVGGTESVVAFLTQGSVQYFPVRDVLLVVFGQSNTHAVDPLGQSIMPVSPMSRKADAKVQARAGNVSLKKRHDSENSPTKVRLLKANTRL
jgi:hypothetical protein